MFKRHLFAVSILFSLNTYSTVIETDSMLTVLRYVINEHKPQETLVIFDIDHTLFHAQGHVGNTPWFEHVVKKHMSDGLTSEQAFWAVMKTVATIHPVLKLSPVEEIIPLLIQELNAAGIPAIALTARPHTHVDPTIRQLALVNIDFSATKLSVPTTLQLNNAALYHQGIIYSYPNPKGKVLLEFLHTNQLKPKRIVFVDDSLKNVLCVEKHTKEQNIDCVAIHYKHMHKKELPFDAQAAEEELQILYGALESK